MAVIGPRKRRGRAKPAESLGAATPGDTGRRSRNRDGPDSRPSGSGDCRMAGV